MIYASSSSVEGLLNKVTSRRISISDNGGAIDDLNDLAVIYYVAGTPAEALATKWLQSLTMLFKDKCGPRKR